ncbi:transcription elongation factor GreA [Oligoflexia bacterium]|nr:transcription elongation factor GreA [Oligoflexia bacterium]
MKYPMTPRGYNAMREELRTLKGMRPELANAIEVARAHGDLSENADYDAAKEKSGMVEAKIRDLELKLTTAEIIDPSKLKNPDRVVFGVTTKVEDLDSGDTRVVSIVGADESNIEKGRISLESPLGRSLIGKEIGDTATVKLPAGVREYEVLEIFVDYDENAN